MFNATGGAAVDVGVVPSGGNAGDGVCAGRGVPVGEWDSVVSGTSSGAGVGAGLGASTKLQSPAIEDYS